MDQKSSFDSDIDLWLCKIGASFYMHCVFYTFPFFMYNSTGFIGLTRLNDTKNLDEEIING